MSRTLQMRILKDKLAFNAYVRLKSGIIRNEKKYYSFHGNVELEILRLIASILFVLLVAIESVHRYCI